MAARLFFWGHGNGGKEMATYASPSVLVLSNPPAPSTRAASNSPASSGVSQETRNRMLELHSRAHMPGYGALLTRNDVVTSSTL